MSIDEVIEQAIQGHASTRDAIRWAMQQEREACAKVCDGWPDYNVQGLAEAIRARGIDVAKVGEVGIWGDEREWVGLTDEEIKEIVGPWGETPIKGYTRKLFDQIEAKLKEKNS